MTVDTAGRVLLPKGVRDRLGLEPGDRLDLVEADEQITLKPVRQTMPLEKREGFWVYVGELPPHQHVSDVVSLIADDREARAAAVFGGTLRARKGE